MDVDFVAASNDFVALIGRVKLHQLEQPGLGEWTLRELIAHTSRALTTVSEYLSLGEPPDVTIHTAEDYLMVMLAGPGTDRAIAARGRDAAMQLGADVVAGVRERRDNAVGAVAAADPDRRVSNGLLAMPLAEYLRTRVWELTVHGLDIADAAGLEWEPRPAHLDDALRLASANAVQRGHGATALRMLTGRPVEPGALEGVMRTPLSDPSP